MNVDYVGQINECERKVLIDLLLRLAGIDNTFQHEELGYISELSSKYNVPMSSDPSRTVKELCDEVLHDTSKVIIALELIKVARADHEFCDEEKKFVKEVLNNFGISYDKYQEMNLWIKYGWEWSKKGQRIISTLKPIE